VGDSPYTRRVGFLSGPSTSWRKSDAPSATFGRSRTSPSCRRADAEANDSFHAIQRAETLASDRDGVHRGEPRCFAARCGVELRSRPPDELGRMPFSRQGSGEKEKGADLHRFRIRSERLRRNRKVDT
jgi:hypothetical protein